MNFERRCTEKLCCCKSGKILNAAYKIEEDSKTRYYRIYRTKIGDQYSDQKIMRWNYPLGRSWPRTNVTETDKASYLSDFLQTGNI